MKENNFIEGKDVLVYYIGTAGLQESDAQKIFKMFKKSFKYDNNVINQIFVPDWKRDGIKIEILKTC